MAASCSGRNKATPPKNFHTHQWYNMSKGCMSQMKVIPTAKMNNLSKKANKEVLDYNPKNKNSWNYTDISTLLDK